MPLANIRIVLVGTTHPGNIGAAARAMKNMALESLYLVAPQCFPDPEASARAAGAADVLERAVVCASLDEAIAPCVRVVGTSARARRIDWPTIDPATGARELLTGARQGPVALLFGVERSGLTNEELDRCQSVISIPANAAFASLNLAAAVQILAYELYAAHRHAAPPDVQPTAPPASHEEMRHLFQHLERVLVRVEFLDPQNPRLLMRRLVRLFQRAALDRNEMNILRGILTAVERQLPPKT